MPLTNTQYDEIMRRYSERQINSRRIQAERTKRVQREIPRLSEIEGEIASLSVQKARFLLKKDAPDLDLARALEDRKQEKKALLLSHGLPEDYLDPVYVCPICKDTGYVDNQKCICFQQLEAELLLSASNLSLTKEGERFEDFSLLWYSDKEDERGISPRKMAEAALQVAKDFTSSFTASYENLLITGPVGVGKTLLSRCIGHELLDMGQSVLYLSSHELFSMLGRYEFSRSEERPEDARQLRDTHTALFDCALLIIDDLGTELTNAFTSSQLFALINERFYDKKSVLLSTNLDLNQIRDKYSERIASRIAGTYTILPLTGEDIRIQKKMHT